MRGVSINNNAGALAESFRQGVQIGRTYASVVDSRPCMSDLITWCYDGKLRITRTFDAYYVRTM